MPASVDAWPTRWDSASRIWLPRTKSFASRTSLPSQRAARATCAFGRRRAGGAPSHGSRRSRGRSAWRRSLGCPAVPRSPRPPEPTHANFLNDRSRWSFPERKMFHPGRGAGHAQLRNLFAPGRFELDETRAQNVCEPGSPRCPSTPRMRARTSPLKLRARVADRNLHEIRGSRSVGASPMHLRPFSRRRSNKNRASRSGIKACPRRPFA
jgi:hypothetical protein